MSEKIVEKGSSLSSIFSNPQYIHIFVEVVTIAGVIIYFSKTIKTLNNKVDILAHKIEEQQALISNHQDVIKKLVESVQTLNSQISILKQANFVSPIKKSNNLAKSEKVRSSANSVKPLGNEKKSFVKKNVKNIDEIAESFASALPTMFAYRFDTEMKYKKVDVEEIKEEDPEEMEKSEEKQKESEETEGSEIDYDKELEEELEEFK
jgi:hypothetical protein